jgi:hypothetical protein
MGRPIRILDPVSQRMTCLVCRGTDSVSELHLPDANQTTVTMLCRPCLTRLAHAITSRLVQLERDRAGEPNANLSSS